MTNIIEEDLERDYLKDTAQIEAEMDIRLMAEWQEWEEYENRLPAKISVIIEKGVESEQFQEKV